MSTTLTSPSSAAQSARRATAHRSRLRLLAAPVGQEPHGGQSVDTPSPVNAEPEPRSSAHVLVVGSDERGRSRMLEELRGLLPDSTRFLEACETWEVLARAAGSRMVVLTGDLQDLSSGSLVRLLARRHPSLPVLAVGERTSVSTAASPPSR